MNISNQKMNTNSDRIETPNSEATGIERRQHPRGTLIESLADITYKVMRDYERTA